MQKTVIILTNGVDFETWTSLTKLCRHHGFSYGYLKNKRYPFIYRKLQFIKLKLNEPNGI
jgi:hypothetical protein